MTTDSFRKLDDPDELWSGGPVDDSPPPEPVEAIFLETMGKPHDAKVSVCAGAYARTENHDETWWCGLFVETAREQMQILIDPLEALRFAHWVLAEARKASDKNLLEAGAHACPVCDRLFEGEGVYCSPECEARVM
jgi:hypothetical protein